jgi:hypothetical protein
VGPNTSDRFLLNELSESGLCRREFTFWSRNVINNDI